MPDVMPNPHLAVSKVDRHFGPSLKGSLLYLIFEMKLKMDGVNSKLVKNMYFIKSGGLTSLK